MADQETIYPTKGNDVECNNCAVSGVQSFPTGRVAITYAATMTPDASKGNFQLINVSDGNAFTVANPTNLVKGEPFFLTLKNTSGGAMGAVTLGNVFKAPSLTLPATGFERTYAFFDDGTNLRLLWQSAADVPN